MKRVSLAVVLLGLAVAAPAWAGERTAVGDVPTLPTVKDAESPGKTMGVPGLTLKEVKTSTSSFYEISAAIAQGYCIVDRAEVFELSNLTTSVEPGEVWRFVEKDGGATLERSRYQVASYLGNAWVKSKSSVELKSLGAGFGITVWGMREANGDVVVIAKRATFGTESGPHALTSEGSSTVSSCAFGAVRIRAAALKSGGGTAQLSGRLPAEGEGKTQVEPQFVVDISAVKVARDPAPVISVRVRKPPTAS